MPSLLFRLLGDASPLRRTFAGLRTDARQAGAQVGAEFDKGMNGGRGGGDAFGGRVKSAMGFGRSFKQLRGLLGGIGGVSAIGWAKGKVEEGGRLQNLSEQMGVSTQLIERAELAQKLYGDQVLKSTDALKKAMESLQALPAQSEAVTQALSNEAREWQKLAAEAKSVGGGVAAAGSSGARGIINNAPLPFFMRLALAPFGSKPTTPTDQDLTTLVDNLGGGGSKPGAKTKLENLPGIKPPTGDALQRIGLFVGGTPIGMDNSKIQRAQLSALQRIETNTRKTYEGL